MHNPSSENISPDNRTKYCLSDLIEQMKLLDVDIKPFFAIAANDILIRHGRNAALFARLSLDQMTRDNNPDGIYLWKELYNTLTRHQPKQQITIH